MKHLFVLAFVIFFVFFGVEPGYTAASPWYTHLTYMFQHANFMHLLLNSIGFILMAKVLQTLYPFRRIIAVSMLCAFSCSFLVYYDKPVVGSSGIVYAMMGMYLYHLLRALFKNRFRDPAPAYMYLVAVVVMLGIGFARENSAGMLHLLCLAAGAVCAMSISILKRKPTQRK